MTENKIPTISNGLKEVSYLRGSMTVKRTIEANTKTAVEDSFPSFYND